MSNYLDDQHRAEISNVLNTFTGRTEWPTWLLIIAFYSAWIGLVFFGQAWGKLASAGVLLPLAVLWMSIQHECIHGHPTRWPFINKALGYLPFAIWYPYDLYRSSHLAHHADETLTLPGVDPESRYISVEEWERSSGFKRLMLQMNKTVAGRLVIGVPMALGALIFADIPKAIVSGGAHLHMWIAHSAGVAIILWTVEQYSALSAWEYIVYVSVPALAIGMLRSFYEHRPAERPEHRSVLNESRGLFSWLFLNLNFHLIHHDLPKLPWYFLPTLYSARRQDWIDRSNGYVVGNYRELATRYLSVPIDHPVHPLVPPPSQEVSTATSLEPRRSVQTA
ncbi:fatty acid desaturase [Pseudomonas sp. SLFW]|uniref:fatty acid desaturase n=1 Tax=Pseudomonas sp. SLFW TaxID=2683259 RepID=UPI001412FE0C|nr:fatty acid desaturase [Pseudomonas sp. SLFW]NBB09648.1 fatty acid desaturase [Pseudomonas sp. SLFW]